MADLLNAPPLSLPTPLPADAPTEEILLRDHLRGLGENRTGVYAVHVHLSQLRPSNQQPHFIRIAARVLEGLVLQAEAVLFQLSNADLVLVCRDLPVDEVDSALQKVRALFSEDPLSFDSGGAFGDRLATWYDLSLDTDHASFLASSGALAQEALERRRRESICAPAMTGERLNPSNLAAIVQKLQETRIADLVRQQTAIEVRPGGTGNALFRETYVAMSALQRRIAPKVNLLGNPWLFLYLTEILDRRMLAVVARQGLTRQREPVGLNLNISTVLARDFQHFHRTAGAAAPGTVIEIQLIDALADLHAFAQARDALHEQGYKVLIDGLTPLTMQFFDPRALDADLIKIGWSREFLGEDSTERVTEMRALVEAVGRHRVVLSRAESEDAVKWAIGLGIRRYQGRFIDRVVAAMAEKGMV